MSDDYDPESRLTIDETPTANGEATTFNPTNGSPDISLMTNSKTQQSNSQPRTLPSVDLLVKSLKTTKSDKSSHSPSLNGKTAEDRPRPIQDESPARKRKKDESTTPRSRSSSSATNHDRRSPERPSKKRKVQITNNKSCQTEYDENCELRPDIRVLLDVTLVFATDPNTLFFTTNWKGRQYHGVITDGISPKTHLLARERAERMVNSKNAVGLENGQNIAVKRGKRFLNRGNERKGRLNLEDCLVFDGPSSLREEEVKRADQPPTLTRCPHKQCGHVFQSTAQVNQHLIFRHVNEKAILTESTASQSTPVRTHSTGCDPIPELPTLCANCSTSLCNFDLAGKLPNPTAPSVDESDGKLAKTKTTGAVKTARSSTPFSDISDDAPTLIKEESFEKRYEHATGQPLNFTSPLLIEATSSPIHDSSNAQDPTDSSSVSEAVANEPRSSLSTPTSTCAQLPQTAALGIGGSLPFASPQPPTIQKRQHTASIPQHQLYFNSFLSTPGSSNSNPLVVPISSQTTRKVGGVATAGSPFSVTDPLSRASANGTGVDALPNSDVMRQKVPEFKSENSIRQSPSTSTSITQQTASPNPTATNVITSIGNSQRGQPQQAAFVRPSAYPLQFPSFFPRPPLAHLQHLNPQQLMQLAAIMNPASNVSNLFMPAPANRNEFN